MNAKVGDWALCSRYHEKQYTINKPYRILSINTDQNYHIKTFNTIDDRGHRNGLSEKGFKEILSFEEAQLAEMLFG